MKTSIDIAELLGQDIIFRSRINDLLSHIENLCEDSIVIDFSGVKFITRSFADEYYNVIMKNQNIKIETVNIPEDIKLVFDAVRNTQYKKKNVELTAKVVRCEDFAELQNVFSSLMF